MHQLFVFIHVLLDVVCVLLCGWAGVCLFVFLFAKVSDKEIVFIVRSWLLGALALAWLIADFIVHKG